MKYRKLDPNGDYKFGGFNQFLVDSPDAVIQAVKTRLGLMTGEWFLNTSEGTDYAGSVFGFVSQDTRDLVLKQRILGTPGVVELVTFESSLNSAARSYSARGSINTVYGNNAELEL